MPRSILIADDSVTIRRVVELAFSDTDIRVEAAGNGPATAERIVPSLEDVFIHHVQGEETRRARAAS